jgi:hypothetical protein
VFVLYDVDLSFPRGLRKIEHSLSNERALLGKADILDQEGLLILYLPPEPQALEDWKQKVATAIPIANEWVLLDALGRLLVDVFYDKSDYTINDNGRVYGVSHNPSDDAYGNTTSKTLSSTRVNVNFKTDQDTASLLKDNVFHTARFDRIDPLGGEYDPKVALSLAEALLNDVLTNITLSTISLGTWWDMVRVTTTRYRSTYSFANPLSLVLPYSICLTASALFAAIAI